MEGGEREGSGGARYTLRPERISNEDVLFCVDVDPECMSEMRPGPNGRALTRLDSVKQAILLFVNAKLTINPEHRFAFSVLSKSVSWIRKEFNSDVESAKAACRAMNATSSPGHADLTTLFRMAAHEAKKSRAQKRILRVILIYCRSSLKPQHQWPVNQKIFTMDVLYLHDKPGPDNCPQLVYDKLVEALEHVTEFEGYILESGQGLSRTSSVTCLCCCVTLSSVAHKITWTYLGLSLKGCQQTQHPVTIVYLYPANESEFNF